MANDIKQGAPRPSVGRHPHDLSHRVLYTSAPGMLLPVFFDFLFPGDHIKVNERLFTRTQPVKTAAFCRILQNVDYFFVPIKQIDPYFHSAYFGIQDNDNANDFVLKGSSPASGGYLPTKVPTMTLSDFKKALFNVYNTLHYSLNVNGSVTTYNFYSDGTNDTDLYGVPSIWNVLRLMDMLNYGSRWVDVNTALTSSYVNSANNRLVNFNVFAVYQKIFYDYYRRQDYQNNDVFSYSLGHWYKNGGFTQEILQGLGESIPRGLFCLRYHPLKRDYYTNTQPSPLFDPTQSATGYYNTTSQGVFDPGVINSAVLDSYGIDTTNLSNKIGFAVTNDGVTLQNANNSLNSQPYQVSLAPTLTQNIRFAFAYEKMLMITQRAAKHYDAQVQAHFGFKVPRGVHDEVYFLGGHTNRLPIGQVIATASGSDGESSSSLGEIAGIGVGSSKDSQRDIEFTAPCHGYLMAIQSTVPEVDYIDTGMSRLNAYTRITDFPRPEFDRLGMEPLYYWEAYNAFPHVESTLDSSVIMGWTYRNQAYKLSYDVVHGAFNYTLKDWVAAYTFGTMVYWNNGAATVPYNILAQLYCPPTILDNLFALSFLPPREDSGDYLLSSIATASVIKEEGQPSDTVPWSNSILYQRDPFLNSLELVYHKVNFMSPFGMPNV